MIFSTSFVKSSTPKQFFLRFTFNKNPVITVKDMLRDETEKGKPRILILLRHGDYLCTMFKTDPAGRFSLSSAAQRKKRS